MKRQVLALALLAAGLLAATPVDEFNRPARVFGSGEPAQPASDRKVIFIQGIDSSGLPSPTNPDCQSQERNTQRLWNVICSLREVLHGVVLPEDIIWFSYKSGDEGYYDTKNYTLPKYEPSDTCDGVATAAEELDRLIRKFPNATFDIVGHSLGGLVAAYWATGGTEDEQWRSDDPPFLRDRLHAIITLDSPLNDTEKGFFRVTRCGVPFEDKEDILDLDPLPGAVILECKPHPDPDTEQSWADLTGCDPTITNKITDADATGSIVVTSTANFVHVNSTGIGDLLPGYWREDNPPCRPGNVSEDPFDVASAFMGFAHTCMLSDPKELRAVRKAVRTDLYDDPQAVLGPLPGHKWITPPDLSTSNTDGWVRGSAQKTQTTGDFASFFDVGGAILKVLYTGTAGAKGQLRVDGMNQGAMPDQDGCVKYGFGHNGFVDLAPLPPDRRPHLCQWSIGVQNGVHTVEVASDIDCGQVCPEFYFDAVEALPPIGLRVATQSPVNMLITDPDGRRVGFDQSTETSVNEIPGATYSGPGAWPQVIQIPTALPERYELLILGAEAGEFQVTIETVSEGGFVESTKQVQGVAAKDSRDLQKFEMAAEGDLNFLPSPP